MRHQPTAQEGRESLVAHAADKAFEAHAIYGNPVLGISLDGFTTFLNDRKFVRHPVTLRFDSSGLSPGELAHPQALDENDPSAGFIMHVHPSFADRGDIIPLVVAYQLVTVNYGEIANHEVAEAFGAALCGMNTEDYYQTLCQLADSLP